MAVLLETGGEDEGARAWSTGDWDVTVEVDCSFEVVTDEEVTPSLVDVEMEFCELLDVDAVIEDDVDAVIEDDVDAVIEDDVWMVVDDIDWVVEELLIVDDELDEDEDTEDKEVEEDGAVDSTKLVE